MKTAVLIPTLFRPGGLRRVLYSLQMTAPGCIPVVIAEPKDYKACKIAVEFKSLLVICSKEKQGPAYAWNEGLKFAPDYDAYFLGSDDIEFTHGWYNEVRYLLREELHDSGVIGCNDDFKDIERIKMNRIQPTQIFMTRDFIMYHNGGVAACPHYRHEGPDYEICLRARKINKFAFAENAIVIHHWRKVDDSGYKEADKYRSKDKVLLRQRQEKDFPDDFEPIIKEKQYI